MSLFSRISDILSANLNALLDRAENPEVMLNQLIREMEDCLVRARRYAAVAIAAEIRLRRDRDDNHALGEQWKSRAREALVAGREELARQALARKQEHEALARGLEHEHSEALRVGQSARTTLEALGARLTEARRKQQVLIARHRIAQVRVEVYRYLGAGQSNFVASQARFDRLADRISERVDELAAEAELHDRTGLEADFTDLERQRAIARELEALKHDPRGKAD